MKPNERILELAKELVGKKETSPNRSPEIDEMKIELHGATDTLAYCADTIRWLASKVDAEMGTANALYATRSARSMWNLTPKGARLASPEPGCAVIWGFYDKEGQPTPQGHCGLYVASLPGHRMQTFEGNTGPTPSDAEHEREGDGFWLRERSEIARLGPMRLLGFLKIWL